MRYDESCRHVVDKRGGCSRWVVGFNVSVLNDIWFGILMWSEPGCLSSEYDYTFKVISYAISRVFTLVRSMSSFQVVHILTESRLHGDPS